MKSTMNIVIRKELIDAGASRSEVNELALLASDIAKLKNDHSFVKPSHTRPRTTLRHKRFVFALSAVIASFLIVIVGIGLITQRSLPGNKLYSVKQRSEDAFSVVDPNFQKTIIMRRAQEVNELVAANASPNLILDTLDDYQSDVWTYNINDATVLNYCRSKLRMAALNASPEVKAAIYRTLGSFPIT